MAMFLIVFYLMEDSEEQIFPQNPIRMLFPGLTEQRRALEKIRFISGKRFPALFVLHIT